MMLGITTADAIALGTVAASIVAAFLGAKKGEDAAKVSPPQPGMAMIGAGLVDTATLRDLVDAVRDLVDVGRANIAANEKIAHDDMGARIKELADTIDRRNADRSR